jgi:nitric oxide reductase subunit C
MNRLLFGISLLISIGIFAFVINSSRGATGTLPQEVADGYAVWRAYGCESCHTLFGQGGNYAPDLSHIYTLRGEEYIREFMVNPAARHPNQRLMPRFTISQKDTGDLVALLRWASDDAPIAQDWPPNPIQVVGSGGLAFGSAQSSAQDAVNNPLVAEGRLIYSQRCASCHAIEDGVILVGPSFYGLASRAGQRVAGLSAEEYIRASILYPSEYLVEGFGDLMQKNFSEVLSSDDISAITAYLMTFTEGS